MPADAKAKGGGKNDNLVLKVVKLERFDLQPHQLYETFEESDALFERALVNMDKATIIEHQDELILCAFNRTYAYFRDYQTFIKDYKYSKKKKYKYALVDFYAARNLGKFDYARQRLVNELHAILPNIHTDLQHAISMPQPAAQVRYMLKNQNLRQNAVDWLQDLHLVEKPYQHNVPGGREINIIRFYGSIMKHPIYVEERPKNFIKYGAFLQRRGFKGPGRRLFPKDYDGTVTERWMHYAAIIEPESPGSSETKMMELQFWNDSRVFNRESVQLEDRYVHHLSPLTNRFPHRTIEEGLELVDYYALRDTHNRKTRNWYEWIICGVFFPKLKYELKELDKIEGPRTVDLFLMLFIFIMKFGYVDVQGSGIYDTLGEMCSAGFIGWVTGTKELYMYNDQKVYDLKCCDNENHVVKYGKYNEYAERRRLWLHNYDNDGECCYRWMWKNAFPKMKLKEGGKKNKKKTMK